MTDDIMDEPITYSTDEDDIEVADTDVPDETTALPGHPLYPSEDVATDSITEGETDGD